MPFEQCFTVVLALPSHSYCEYEYKVWVLGKVVRGTQEVQKEQYEYEHFAILKHSVGDLSFRNWNCERKP